MKKSDKDLKWYNDTLKMLDGAESQVRAAIDRRDFIQDQLKSYEQNTINKCRLQVCECGDIPDIVTGNMSFPYVQCSCGERTNPSAFVGSAINEWNAGERRTQHDE